MKQFIKIIGIMILLSNALIMSMDQERKFISEMGEDKALDLAIIQSLQNQLEQDDLDKAIAASLKNLKIDQTDKKKFAEEKPTVKPDDACPICMEEAKKFKAGQILITQCCKKFICKPDLQELEKTAQQLWNDVTNQEWRDQYILTDEYRERDFPKPREPKAECPLCKAYPVKTKEASVKK